MNALEIGIGPHVDEEDEFTMRKDCEIFGRFGPTNLSVAPRATAPPTYQIRDTRMLYDQDDETTPSDEVATPTVPANPPPRDRGHIRHK